MASVFSIKRRDNRPWLRGTLWADTPHTEPVDLTNAEVLKVKVGIEGNPLLIDRAITILDPASGKFETQFSIAETNQLPATYQMEFEVTWTNGDVSTYPKEGFLQFVVFPDLDPPAPS
jgi:hypothetical protein